MFFCFVFGRWEVLLLWRTFASLFLHINRTLPNQGTLRAKKRNPREKKKKCEIERVSSVSLLVRGGGLTVLVVST